MSDLSDVDPCPSCGALPCDWSNNPFAPTTGEASPGKDGFVDHCGWVEEVPTGWQDIASAPKDGTEIIVFHPVAGVCAAFCPKEGFAWHCMDGSNTRRGTKSGVSIPTMTSFISAPTHWMHLPLPPEPKP